MRGRTGCHSTEQPAVSVLYVCFMEVKFRQQLSVVSNFFCNHHFKCRYTDDIAQLL